jgi:outer membrane biosynthesis protein TonB
MNNSVYLLVVLLATFTVRTNSQSAGEDAAKTEAVPNMETKYALKHLETDPRFIVSIERVGRCKLPGSPISTTQLRIGSELYPEESVKNHEEGTAKMQLIFDANWCVRKAIIIESSKYWRLDDQSLKWAMTIKWQPSKTKFTPDGQPTVTLPVPWGASQGRHKNS